MIDYQGCKCPVCQKPLTQEDDIVVCPECGAPYHRACWQQHGGCVFADRHGPGFEYRRPEDGPQPLDPPADQPPKNGASGELPCPVCGAQNPAGNIFCESCGAPLHGMSGNTPGAQPYDYSRPMQDPLAMAGLTPDQEIDGIKVSDWMKYLGNSAPYYLAVFHRMDQTGHKFFPSFSALFFGPLFLLYRKVWNWGVLSAVLSLVCSIPLFLLLILASNQPSAQPAALLLTAEKISTVLSLVLQLALMLFSFLLVRRESAKKIRKLQQTASSPEEFQRLLQAKASPSWVGVVIFVVVCLVIGLAMQPLFGPHLAEVLFGSTTLF